MNTSQLNSQSKFRVPFNLYISEGDLLVIFSSMSKDDALRIIKMVLDSDEYLSEMVLKYINSDEFIRSMRESLEGRLFEDNDD